MSSTATFRLHRTNVEIHGDGPDRLEVVTEILAYYGARRSSESPSTIHAELTLTSEGRPADIPATARLEGDFGGVRAWVTEKRVWVETEGFCFEIDLAAGRAVGFLDADVWRRPTALGQGAIVPFVLSLMMLLRRHRLFAAHAAAVALEGDGCVLLGAGGSGKSTQALGLVTAGWDHLSDDSLLIDGGSEEIEILALRRNFYLTPEAASSFPELAASWQDCALTAGPKRRLAMKEAFPGQVAESCRPRWLLFSRIVASDTSRLVPLAKAEALHRLLHQSDLVTLEPENAPIHLGTLKRLLDQTTSFELLAGRDLKDEPAAVEPLLRSVMTPRAVEVPSA